MKPIVVRSLESRKVIGTLRSFAVSETGVRYAVVAVGGRALDVILTVDVNFNRKYEVK